MSGYGFTMHSTYLHMEKKNPLYVSDMITLSWGKGLEPKQALHKGLGSLETLCKGLGSLETLYEPSAFPAGSVINTSAVPSF